jgi:hypothetical protein
MSLTLEADNFHLVKWWVDASFAVHPDMKSHTGGAMSTGSGAIYGTSTRQKINTKSSTEGELVAVNDVLLQILWTKYFLEAQGYSANNLVKYQDNKSTMLLEKNSKRTRHLNIRYFLLQIVYNQRKSRFNIVLPTIWLLISFPNPYKVLYSKNSETLL